MLDEIRDEGESRGARMKGIIDGESSGKFGNSNCVTYLQMGRDDSAICCSVILHFFTCSFFGLSYVIDMAICVTRCAFEIARPVRSHDAAAFFQACRSQVSVLRRPRPQRITGQRTAAYRSFTTTRPSQATVVKRNPRTDDDGNEMSINISDRAAKRLKQIVSTPPKKNTLSSASQTTPDSHLRVTVTAGGCHGFQYLMSLEPKDKIDAEEDTIFEFEDSGEAKAEVVLDQPSLEMLKGSTIDFTTELIGSQFKIVGNPRATSSCGCGTSFDIE